MGIDPLEQFFACEAGAGADLGVERVEVEEVVVGSVGRGRCRTAIALAPEIAHALDVPGAATLGDPVRVGADPVHDPVGEAVGQGGVGVVADEGQFPGAGRDVAPLEGGRHVGAFRGVLCGDGATVFERGRAHRQGTKM